MLRNAVVDREADEERDDTVRDVRVVEDAALNDVLGVSRLLLRPDSELALARALLRELL